MAGRRMGSHSKNKSGGPNRFKDKNVSKSGEYYDQRHDQLVSKASSSSRSNSDNLTQLTLVKDLTNFDETLPGFGKFKCITCS